MLAARAGCMRTQCAGLSVFKFKDDYLGVSSCWLLPVSTFVQCVQDCLFNFKFKDHYFCVSYPVSCLQWVPLYTMYKTVYLSLSLKIILCVPAVSCLQCIPLYTMCRAACLCLKLIICVYPPVSCLQCVPLYTMCRTASL